MYTLRRDTNTCMCCACTCCSCGCSCCCLSSLCWWVAGLRPANAVQSTTQYSAQDAASHLRVLVALAGRSVLCVDTPCACVAMHGRYAPSRGLFVPLVVVLRLVCWDSVPFSCCSQAWVGPDQAEAQAGPEAWIWASRYAQVANAPSLRSSRMRCYAALAATVRAPRGGAAHAGTPRCALTGHT